MVPKISVEFLMREHYGIEDHQLGLDVNSLACGTCKVKERHVEKDKYKKEQLLVHIFY